MQLRLLLPVLFLGASLVWAAAEDNSEEEPYDKEDDEYVKTNDTAAGRRQRHRNRYRGRNDYGAYNYGGYRNSYNQQPYYIPPPLMDNYVCDLDASILLTTNSYYSGGQGYGNSYGSSHGNGYGNSYGNSYGANNAVRVRCADVTNDEYSCQVCCQNSARKDTSIANDQIRSFLALVDSHKKKHEKDEHKDSDEDDDDSEEYTRKKRGANYDDKYGKHHDKSYEDHDGLKVKSKDWKPDDYYRNIKCICCAPKRNIPTSPISIIGQSPPVASNFPYNQRFPQQPIPLVNVANAPAQPPGFVPQTQTGSWGTIQPVNNWGQAAPAQPIGGNNWAQTVTPVQTVAQQQPTQTQTGNWVPVPPTPITAQQQQPIVQSGQWAPAPQATIQQQQQQSTGQWANTQLSTENQQASTVQQQQPVPNSNTNTQPTYA